MKYKNAAKFVQDNDDQHDDEDHNDDDGESKNTPTGGFV